MARSHTPHTRPSKHQPLRPSGARAPARPPRGPSPVPARYPELSSGRKPAEPIALSELLERLADPKVPEQELMPYLSVASGGKRGMTPILVPNDKVQQQDDPALAARGGLGLGLLNGVYRIRRRRQFETRIANGDPRPILLAEGDSWFEYPVWLEDVVDWLNVDHNVFCVSGAGDELKGMVADAEYADYLEELIGRQKLKVKAVLLSGGGNDIAGPELKALLRPFDKALDAAGHIEPARLKATFAGLRGHFETIVGRVAKRYPNLPILVHGYDYAIPRPPQGFHIPPKDGWLGDPLRARGILQAPMQKQIIRLMMDAFYAMLGELAGGNGAGRFRNVFLVDNRDCVKARWADELHPDDAGFRDVANRFRAVLKTLS